MSSGGGIAVDTKHVDMIHAAQFDYYGKRVATCSSDKTIKIHNVSEGNVANAPLADLRGHEGPVWQVAWAHPKFGVILASCSYDRKVFVWKETSPNTWEIIYQYSGHELSVNSVAWAPHEYGLVLACASSDGYISILTFKDNSNTWETTRFTAHNVGVNAVSWAPAAAPSSLLTANSPAHVGPAPRKLVSGGSDKLVKVWAYNDASARWVEEEVLRGHNDWVRDVSWAPSIGLPAQIIASCSQDCTVIIWTQEDPAGAWHSKPLPQKFADVVWTVSWSVTGNILAVASGDNRVSLWKEGVDGEWKQIQSIDDHES